ncbi:MAG: hypothetical protein GY838_05280 [bacterium]|nr:hypothetical protein [bacterium]
MSEEKKLKLTQKLVEIRKAIGILQKETKGQAGKYVDPELILAKVVNAMNDQGVLLTTNILESESIKVDAPSKNNPEKKDYQTSLKMEMVFSDGDSTLGIPWYAIGSHMQDPAMAFGTALSYAERYFMLKTFNIATPELDPEFLKQKANIADELPEELRKEIDSFEDKEEFTKFYQENLNKTCNKKQFMELCTIKGKTL